MFIEEGANQDIQVAHIFDNLPLVGRSAAPSDKPTVKSLRFSKTRSSDIML